MTCEKAFDGYLALDKFEHVPANITLHLLFCPTCRTAVRNLTRAEKVLAKPFVPPREAPQAIDPVVAAAIARIKDSGLSYVPANTTEQKVSLQRWMVCGAIMIACFAFVPFSSTGQWSKTMYGTSYSIPLFLLCGVAVTIYCMFFIATNIDFFVKKFGLQHDNQ
jgi:hypothetical protein